MVSRVGPHAPGGSYARMEFDLAAEPSPSSRPRESTLVLEWSRREDAVALRARARAPGRLELVADDPWGWTARWAEAPDGWRAALGNVEIAAAFEPAADGRVAAVVAWEPRGVFVSAGPGNARLGAENPALARFRRLLPGLDSWIDDARADWDRRRPCSSGAAQGLVEAVADNLMWTVLLQPEAGRLYAPAGRRWIFPKPGGGRPAGERIGRWREGERARSRRLDDLRLGLLLQRPRARHRVGTPGLGGSPGWTRLTLLRTGTCLTGGAGAPARPTAPNRQWVPSRR